MPSPTAAAHPARKIFVLSSLALFAAGMSASLRGTIISSIEREFLVSIDAAASGFSSKLSNTSSSGAPS